MFEKIEFLIGEAFTALWRNLLMTFAAITTVAVSLFLLGSLGFVYLRLDEFGSALPSKFEIRAYLKDGSTKKDVRAAAATIRAFSAVKAAVWVPKDKAWDRWKQEHPETPSDLPNPLAESLKITLADLDQGDSVAAQVRALPAVEEVRYEEEAQNLVAQALKLTRFLGVWVGGLLFLTAGVLIYNAIRLNVLSRRLEMRTMQLVGASRFTIRMPFLIEGMFQGAVGGALAGVLMLGGSAAFARLMTRFSAFGAPQPFPFLQALGMLSLAGLSYGLLCSWLAVRSPLKFR